MMCTLKYRAIFYFFISSIIGMECKESAPYFFLQKTASKVVTLPQEENKVHTFLEPEERQKLCYYAKIEAGLAYIDYNYEPSKWHHIKEEEQEATVDYPFTDAMYCATLPTVYILWERTYVPRLQITIIRSPGVAYFEFNTRTTEAMSASAGHGEREQYEVTDFAKLDIDDRRYLCNAARKHVQGRLYFLSIDVPDVMPHEFKYSNDESIYGLAIACPTLPKLYLRHDRTLKEKVDIILVHETFIDNYHFLENNDKPVSISSAFHNPHLSSSSEMEDTWDTNPLISHLDAEERLILCDITRRYYYGPVVVPFVQDKDVSKAEIFTFKYYNNGEPTWQGAYVIQCSALPSIYLRLIDFVDGIIRIMPVMGPKSAYDKLTYIVESIDDKMEKSEWQLIEPYKTMLANHWFKELSEEEHWNLCFAAQKYILKIDHLGRSFKNRFACSQFLLIPKYVKLEIYKYQLYGSVLGEVGYDMVIRCSEWPTLYLRQGNDRTEMKINLYGNQLVEGSVLWTEAKKNAPNTYQNMN